MGKPALLGGFTVTADELKKLKTLAKKSVAVDKKVAETNSKLDAARREFGSVKSELSAMTRERDVWKNRYNELMAEVKDFLSAIRNFPQKLREVIDRHWQDRRQQKSYNREESL